MKWVIAAVCGACIGVFLGYELGWPGILLTFPVAIILGMLFGAI
jgi:hypothetical protein